jgi:hypothetical protein
VPRYFLDLPEQDVPQRWDPHAGSRAERADTRYFAGVFTEMERWLDDGDLDVYMTWDVKRLPRYGDRIVAVVLGDETAQIPRYVVRVRAVFKAYGTRPVIGTSALKVVDLVALGEIAQYAARWIRWIPGGATYGWHQLRREASRESGSLALGTIPLGTYNQLDLPLVAMADRCTDLFFAGSIEHRKSPWERVKPKTQARTQMLAAVDQLRKNRPELRVVVRVTPSFDASASSPDRAYSEALMDSRICLAPRGASTETFRVLEGLRYGCLVVCEPLPPHWFYDGAPLLTVDRWRDLEAALSPTLDDPARLEAWQRRACSWWRERCCEAAVGRHMAERLNSLAETPSRGAKLSPSRALR